MSITSPTSLEQTLASLLAVRAKSTPDAVALLAPDHPSLSYTQLLAHIRAVGARLNAWGIGRNDRVAIVLPNGPEMATAFLAVSTWAVSAPLNPAYRAEEFDFYLADLNATALIVLADENSPACAVARARGIQVLELTSQTDEAAGLFTLTGEPRATPSLQEPTENDIALLIYTSGTTSRPKLVPLTQANICVAARNIAITFALTPTDRCLNVMPLFHTHGLIGALFSSLTVGASVVCTPGFSASDFGMWLPLFNPTWYTAVPTMHQAILAQARACQGKELPHALRFIRSTSSALPVQVFKDLEETFQVPVIESYGLAEATSQVTSNPLPPAVRKAGSVGAAIGLEVAIMNEAGTLLPPETVGEVVIRGAHVISGYLDDPGANAAAFTNGWFRTGDQGYLDADGYLFITGRLKEMINRGGEKIAPREVDEVLLTHPAVAEAVTFAVPHQTLGEDVAAAVVLRSGQAETAVRIRQFLFGQLTDFKIPSQVVVVNEIPKGPTGKIQRIGLATQLAQQLKGKFVAPRNDLEAGIARLYAEVLDVGQPGINDNFFALGGDSLRATSLMARVRSLVHVDLPIATLFRKPTVAELSEEIAITLEAIEQNPLAEILAEMAILSDEEAQQLVVVESGQGSSR